MLFGLVLDFERILLRFLIVVLICFLYDFGMLFFWLIVLIWLVVKIMLWLVGIINVCEKGLVGVKCVGFIMLFCGVMLGY